MTGQLACTARCLTTGCGWTAHGDQGQVHRAAQRHTDTEGHSTVATTTTAGAR